MAAWKGPLVSSFPTEQAALHAYITETLAGEAYPITSTFWAALRDARRASGRDQQSGKAVDRAQLGSWLGGIGYLCLLDQIGSLVRPRSSTVGATDGSGNSFNRALQHWTSCGPEECDALYALRCSFAHDFGLMNRGPKPRLRHAFAISEKGPLVSLPQQRWDGQYPAPMSAATVVNLTEVGRLVEQVHFNVQQAHSASALEIAVAGGPAELMQRAIRLSLPPDPEPVMRSRRST